MIKLLHTFFSNKKTSFYDSIHCVQKEKDNDDDAQMISAPKKETFSLLFSCSNWIMFGRVKQERCTHMLYKHLVRENWKICSVRAVDNGRKKSKLWKRIKEAFVSFYFHLPLIFLLTIEKQIHTHTSSKWILWLPYKCFPRHRLSFL